MSNLFDVIYSNLIFSTFLNKIKKFIKDREKIKPYCI